MTVANVRKFLVAIGAAAGVAVTALADGSLNTTEAIAIGLAFLGALGVYRVPNEPVEEV